MSGPLPRPDRDRQERDRAESAADAVAMVLAGLGWLAGADMASVPVAAQAECLRGLERAASVQAAAHARVLGAFCGQAGYEADGQCSPRTWLTWQTQVTRPAASAALASMRRLRDHPEVARALADTRVSVSWARQICEWTGLLPGEHRDAADVILLAAAAAGAELADLARLAEEMRSRLARPSSDPDGFNDRAVRLATTLGGAGQLAGALTPRCAAALQAVLDALGKRAGPEDTRTTAQRHHDALEEAARRLLASGCLPDRAGQPAQLQLHITLDDLTGRPAPRQSGQAPWPVAAPGDDCDASVAPVVTGRVDHDLLASLASRMTGLPPWLTSPCPEHAPCPPGLAGAVALLSGPSGLAAWLRTTRLAGAAASISLPLDIGTATETIPPHLRRAVIIRDRHCAFPGCDQPPAACQAHHMLPRSQGGPTSLANLLLLCTFHHLILIHRWGWTIRLNPDGTTTATSPDGRTLHSHSPPPAHAA